MSWTVIRFTTLEVAVTEINLCRYLYARVYLVMKPLHMSNVKLLCRAVILVIVNRYH